MDFIVPLHFDLHEVASLKLLTVKTRITRIKIFGDSLSDQGGKNGMYAKKIFGCIPLSLFLYKSPHKRFTNGFVWADALSAELESLSKSTNPLDNPYLPSLHGNKKLIENMAQGGATAYKYRGFLDFFKYMKGFFLSFMLTNIQSQAKKIKQEKNKLEPGDLCIIFAGANDLVTVGYCNKGGAKRAIEGITKTIEILTASESTVVYQNCAKNILLFTLPDFSKTPRFSKKSNKAKKKAQEACRFFNQELRNLAEFNANVEVFDAAAVFEKIDKNPEKYEFTSGCAVYYLSALQGKECITQKITSGNAIVLQKINKEADQNHELLCYFVKDGKLVEHGSGSMRLPITVTFTLSQKEKDQLDEKFNQHPFEDCLSQLATGQQKHDAWTTHIVQYAVNAYEKKFGNSIQLADIYASVLWTVKKHLPNEQVIFWDDLHPSVIMHLLLEMSFKQFFTHKYSMKLPRVWLDDMALSERVTKKVHLSVKASEAPAGLFLVSKPVT
jgi:phospholipase/lecithinase/hemolysin